ncbi:MAG: histidine kinase [Candidatus Omnitrophica bacterium CG1_02_49_10]|nr:MAG: histidine kinase [Candidatus Omnitrophica bacterium CG1_02_49_10]
MAKREMSYARTLKAISEVSETITSDMLLEDILRLIVTVTAGVMDSKICSLMLLDEDKKELVIRATQSVSDIYNKKPNVKLGTGISGKVAASGKPITVTDVKTDERYLNRDVARKEKLCSLLCMPLKVKGKTIGVLNNYTSKPHKFTKAEIDTLTTVASQAAIAIENAGLMVKTKVIQEELESRKIVERAKGILMKEQALSEEEAFRKMQKYSMNNRKSMREVAEALILTYQINK